MPLVTHECSLEELGITEDTSKAKFLPAVGGNKEIVQTYQKKFKCAREEDLNIFGDFDSAKARLFNIQLLKCTGRDDCKTPEEITEFFRNKWLLLMFN